MAPCRPKPPSPRKGSWVWHSHAVWTPSPCNPKALPRSMLPAFCPPPVGQSREQCLGSWALHRFSFAGCGRTLQWVLLQKRQAVALTYEPSDVPKVTCHGLHWGLQFWEGVREALCLPTGVPGPALAPAPTHQHGYIGATSPKDTIPVQAAGVPQHCTEPSAACRMKPNHHSG